MALKINEIRADFPILSQTVHGRPLVYLDSSATTQKPQCVIDEICRCYTRYNSNIHRGIHSLSRQSTDAYENARRAVARFINAPAEEEVIFTKGATDSLNLLAYCLCSELQAGDNIAVTQMEHHSNMVPWQVQARNKKLQLQYLRMLPCGDLCMDSLAAVLAKKPKLLSFMHVSNTLGTVNNVHLICRMAKEAGATVVIDASQSVQHFKIDAQKMGCDFLVFSGHKLYGPTGIGVLWGKKELLDKMPPYQCGGDMIETVSLEGPVFNQLPFKFEAGTSNYVGAIALARAIEYVESIGIENIEAHEARLLALAEQGLALIPGLTVYGKPAHRAGAVSFNVEGAHPSDIGMVLDKQGIAIRTGTHCTEPLMQFYGITGTARISLGLYNTQQEIEIAVEAIKKAAKMFA
jgi:cysteine desulfurase / selenocysteine lyase